MPRAQEGSPSGDGNVLQWLRPLVQRQWEVGAIMRTLAIALGTIAFVLLCAIVVGNDAGSAIEIGLLK